MSDGEAGDSVQHQDLINTKKWGGGKIHALLVLKTQTMRWKVQNRDDSGHGVDVATQSGHVDDSVQSD